MKFLAYDSPVMRAISTAADLVLINLLWFVCSLPLLTAGAAMCAKYYVGMKIARGEEPAIIKSFFSSFGKNLKQTLIPSLLAALIAAFLTWDWFYLFMNSDVNVYKWALFVVSLIFLMAVFCFFPIIARYEIKTSEALKMALGMTGARFVRVFFAIVFFALPFVISWWYIKWAWLIILFVHTVMLYYNSRFFVKEFDAVEARLHLNTPDPENEGETDTSTDKENSSTPE